MRFNARVLVVIDGLGGGGAETSLVAVAPGLISRGIDLHVAHLSKRLDLLPRLSSLGVTTHDLSDNSRLENIGALRRLIRQTSPDLVHTTLFTSDVVGRVAAAEARVTSVSSIVNEMYGRSHRAESTVPTHKLFIAQLADASTAQLCSRFHVLSKSLGKTMSRRLCVPAKKMTVIPRGREPLELGQRTHERREAVRARLGLNRDDEVVLCVGRMDEQKGYETLVMAAPQIMAERHQAKFLIAGREGNASITIKTMLRQLGLSDRFHLLGHRSDVADLMVAADALAFPSRREGFGGVLIEAMALRIPTVCSDLPVLREVITADDGAAALTFAAGQPEALAEQLIRLLDNYDLARELADRGQHHFLRNYTIDRVTDQMAAFYQDSIGSGA